MVDKDNCWLTTDIDEELPYLRITPFPEKSRNAITQN
jgi:hypothetical protein